MSKVLDEELIFLDNLIYLNIFSEEHYNEVKGYSVHEIVDYMIEKDDDTNDYVRIHSFVGTDNDKLAAISPDDWISLLENFSSKYEDYSDFWDGYILEDCVAESNENGAFRACTFVKRDDENNVEDIVVVFRGTAGDAREWTDNIINGNRVWSYETDKSVLYIQGLKEYYGEAANHLTVSGHSKGGNRAQYVTILTDQVDRCLSFDGQGFSSEFLELYAEEIEEKKDRITSISLSRLLRDLRGV